MRRAMTGCLVLSSVLQLAVLRASAGDAQPTASRRPRGEGTANQFQLDVPDHPFDLILGRPEKDSVTGNVLTYQDMEGLLAYGPRKGVYAMQTPLRQFMKGVPVELVIGKLQVDAEYYYQFRWRPTGESTWRNGPECGFHTARLAGSPFVFTLTADSHLDEHTSPEVYLRTLANIRADKPDFHIDLGNLFMTDKHASRDEAARQYLAQRYYLGQIGCAVPVFLRVEHA